MKKGLSAYWWCQIGGWALFLLLATFFYFAVPGFTTFDSYFSLVVVVVLGVLTTHLMRLFIIKTKLLNLKIWKQFIYLFLTTIIFSFIYLVFYWIAAVFQGRYEYNPKESFLNNVSAAVFINSQFLAIWNLIYFTYHYIEKSRREQIEKIRLENELQIQQLESKRAKAELEQQAIELEMQALRAQMNPHFIFNSLNSISRFILKNQRVEANDYLTKFSKLIRMILQHSAMPTIKLSNELSMLQLYLELECLRFDKRITYALQCDPDLDTELIKIPPLLLQPYIENAIWHGLTLKKEEGYLWIKIEQKEQYLVCTITDDGIGRKKAAELKNASYATRKSMGMNITANRIALLNQSEQLKSDVKIVDLVLEDGSPGGTQVIINLPLDYD